LTRGVGDYVDYRKFQLHRRINFYDDV